jgi:hypothetical protein
MSSTLPLQPLAFDLVLPWHADKDSENGFYGTLKRVLVPAIIVFFLVQSLEVTHVFIEPENVKSFEEKVIPQTPNPIAITSTKVKSKSPKTVRQFPVSAKEVLETDAKAALIKSHDLSEVSSQLISLRDALDSSKMQNGQVSHNPKNRS